MPSHKLRYCVFSIAAFALLAATPIAPAGGGKAPPVPTISNTHRVFLSRIARRTTRDVVLHRPEYEPDYIPHALGDLAVEVVVRVSQRGYLRATAAAGPGPIAIAVRDAAYTAATSLSNDASFDLESANRSLIEIEVIGNSEPIAVTGDWTLPRAVDPFVEPGIHGLVLTGEHLHHRFCPTELYTSDLVLADALERMAQSSHADPSQLENVKLARFRSVHWYEPNTNGNVVSLHRGLTILADSAVTQTTLDEAIARLAEYMAYRQQGSGLFAYQYEPARDRYSDKQNLVRQIGAVVAMAVHAKRFASGASRAAADLGIRYHLQGLTGFPNVKDAAFIATADGRNKLGVTALLCLAMAEHPEAKRFAETRERLINAILQLQHPSGAMATAFPPAMSVAGQDYFPGEALLAMAVDYSHNPSARVLDAFHRAIDFYKAYFRDTRSPALVPWQVQAFALMAVHTKRRDYSDYAFELADWLAGKQLNPSNCAWQELWGGIAAYSGQRVGVSTASYLEGFSAALDLARHMNDKDRIARYETVVRRAARFVMQLQVRPEEAYFMRSPRDAVGGIRTSPSLNLLRIDHCQHALIGLIKAESALYTDRG